MEYKVRKGIENPCKIHGLLVRDFYLLLGYGGFAVAVLLLNVKSWLEDGTTGGEMLFIFVLLVGCGLLLARKFYKNASRKKYRPPHWEKTVTNRDVRNALNEKTDKLLTVWKVLETGWNKQSECQLIIYASLSWGC